MQTAAAFISFGILGGVIAYVILLMILEVVEWYR